MTQKKSESTNQIPFLYEIWRKTTHMGALVFPLVYLKLEKGEMLAIMIPLALLILTADIARLRKWKFWQNKLVRRLLEPMVREHEAKGDFTGATYILMSFCLTIALYTKAIAIVAITFIIIGDTFAALLGRKIKSPKFYKNKTVAGSLGCLMGMLLVAYFSDKILHDIDIAFQAAAFGAVVGTIFEAFSFGIDDNVTVPLLSGLAMTLFVKIILI